VDCGKTIVRCAENSYHYNLLHLNLLLIKIWWGLVLTQFKYIETLNNEFDHAMCHNYMNTTFMPSYINIKSGTNHPNRQYIEPFSYQSGLESVSKTLETAKAKPRKIIS